jgi:hypothetical protein
LPFSFHQAQASRISGRLASNFLAVQGMIDTTVIFEGSMPAFWAQ